MATKKIVIVIDEESGDAEIRSPKDMADDEVLDILTLAVDATADKVMQTTSAEVAAEEEIQTSAPGVARKREYLN